MHWEPHEFDLPNFRRGMQWTLCINTDDADNNGICPPESLEAGQEPQEELRQYMVPLRVFWYFAALSQFPVRHPKRMAKAGKRVKSVKRQNVRKEPAKEAETVVAAAREL